MGVALSDPVEVGGDVSISLELPYGVVAVVESVSVTELDERLLNCPLLSEVDDAGLDCE